ncbi:hypothetical protein PHYBLDRAFT_166461 [Phycomyces blakesleeanus NRRL 1555(-)]|uniref:Uncharacterized protein n=1 Tax=Phycomyces blakesleeanus (strain ATCC 8743b / DSM 1359 / FGSC 10004 / NBRC 33097 / NRRL 1555) TaxID=763407 RepID=A0A162UH73_PHYB8|nr:hypothetical protein PHYBLDRAFT_166461 [Phycomyces blakesleeanus NRRL 1555(-)]OAD75193.1 hypothetical protein PHYBLDRAFT_166461 [Phycomyces blakesleeanus NRRL 1555(-)]|eukprot:XP_018293233.1 hypothetical protein PHYBLDRAFT_166461 [Phycomyces blakesleeanus NRRL 1555(-)]
MQLKEVSIPQSLAVGTNAFLVNIFADSLCVPDRKTTIAEPIDRDTVIHMEIEIPFSIHSKLFGEKRLSMIYTIQAKNKPSVIPSCPYKLLNALKIDTNKRGYSARLIDQILNSERHIIGLQLLVESLSASADELIKDILEVIKKEVNIKLEQMTAAKELKQILKANKYIHKVDNVLPDVEQAQRSRFQARVSYTCICICFNNYFMLFL